MVSCAAPLSCPSPSCEAGLLPPSMHGEGTVSKQVQKWIEGPPTREKEKEEGEKMQANPAYLPIEMSYIQVTREQEHVLTAECRGVLAHARIAIYIE